MAQGDRDFLGRVIVPLLTFGGVALQLGAARFIRKLVRFGHSSEVTGVISGNQQDMFGHLAEVQDAKEDYLSQLPDDILCSIFAHLSIRDATRTSILSRRWKDLYSSIAFTTLVFNCLDMFGIHPHDHTSCPSYQQKFLKGVNQVLQRYSGLEVDHVRINFCFGRGFSSEFDQCMHSISGIDVERLSLYFDCGTDTNSISLSNSIRDPNKLFKFSLDFLSRASSLKHLLLYHCTVQPSFRVRLNSISTLDLVGVLLENGHLEGILSSCLNLSKLRLECCKLPRKLRIYGTVKSLQFLECGGLEEIDLQATNLRLFECKPYKVEFVFSSVPMLEKVRIQVLGDASMSYIFGDFARDLPTQVKSLNVAACHTQVRYFPTHTQMFKNLRELNLTLASTDDFDIVNIYPLLGACPLLQYLNLEQLFTKRDSGRTWSPLSPTYHTQLRQVTFSGFLGEGAETEFVLFILRGAAVLERMLLSPIVKRYFGGDELIIKRYSGGDELKKWCNISFDERKRNWIRGQLDGQAISRNAVVIFQS